MFSHLYISCQNHKDLNILSMEMGDRDLQLSDMVAIQNEKQRGEIKNSLVFWQLTYRLSRLPLTIVLTQVDQFGYFQWLSLFLIRKSLMRCISKTTKLRCYQAILILICIRRYWKSEELSMRKRTILYVLVSVLYACKFSNSFRPCNRSVDFSVDRCLRKT